MCGIYGCIGNNAYQKVLDGLKKLQYRGYDSCGIAYFNKTFKVEKTVGPLNNLKIITTDNQIAFGHTRWATNGAVTIENAHPHLSYDNEYIIVHNGIIKNANIIKQDLIKNNVDFKSDTDTEVIVNYIAYHSKNSSCEKVLKSMLKDLEGSYSLIIGNKAGDLYLIKKFSPLNLLISDDEIYVSSDISSLKNGELYSLQDNDIIKISNKHIINLNESKLNFEKHINSTLTQTLYKHKHFMEKEIYETPEAIKQTYLSIKDVSFNHIFDNYEKFTLIGCGTAYHSCLIGEYLLKETLNKTFETILASNYEVTSFIDKKHLHIIVSQSGETADCIKVAEQIKHNGGKILIITNEKHSTMAKLADFHIFTHAEKEIAVASTKTYCCQLFVFAYICKKLINKNYDLDINALTNNLKEYINYIQIDEIANKLKNIDKMILIAKGIDYITILEACLKIREIDYIYTLPMYAGELKHGTLSLIEKGSIVLALNTSLNLNKLDTAKNEIKSRNGEIIDFSSFVSNKIDLCFKPIYAIIPFQLLSYKISLLNGRNPDMPRNLAKSVTVE